MDGNTALHYAVDQKHKSIIKALLKTEVNLALKNNQGKTVIDVCNSKQILQVINLSFSNFNDMRFIDVRNLSISSLGIN